MPELPGVRQLPSSPNPPQRKEEDHERTSLRLCVCDFSAICMVLSGYSMNTGDHACMILAFAFAIIVVLLSGFVLVCRCL